MPISSEADGGHSGPADQPAARGRSDYTVHMYFRNQYIGKALVKGVWGMRTARACALRGIATSIVPMSDKDLVQWHRAKAEDFNP